MPYVPSGRRFLHLFDIGLSVDEIGAAPPGWYTDISRTGQKTNEHQCRYVTVMFTLSEFQDEAG